jgi:NAD(P)-dependent dehydrogenase (short-subunit alcohol dehydrogenase family)
MGFIRNKVNGPRTDESIDMYGKVVIITGSNSGIGKYTAKVLAKNGAHVIMACRNLDNANKAKQEIVSEYSHAQITLLKIDTSKLDVVDQFVTDFLRINLPLHVLIANAGGVFYSEDKEGLDPIFTTNHLGHHSLITKLLPIMKTSGTESDPARIVFVSSDAHNQVSNLTPDQLDTFTQLPRQRVALGVFNSITKYYGFAKLVNCMLCYQLNEDFKRQGVKNVITNSIHPGAIRTDIWKYIDQLPKLEQWIFGSVIYLASFLMKDEEYGAQPLIYASTSPDMINNSGRYLYELNVSNYSPLVLDDNLRKVVLDMCDKLVNTSEK